MKNIFNKIDIKSMNRKLDASFSLDSAQDISTLRNMAMNVNTNYYIPDNILNILKLPDNPEFYKDSIKNIYEKIGCEGLSGHCPMCIFNTINGSQVCDKMVTGLPFHKDIIDNPNVPDHIKVGYKLDKLNI